MAIDISATLSAIATQFDADVNRDSHITLAKLRTSLSTWDPEKYPYAVALRAAHTLTLSKLASDHPGVPGAIVGEGEGDQSITFLRGKEEDEYLSMTIYGKDLLSLIKGSILPLDLVNRYKSNSFLNVYMYL